MSVKIIVTRPQKVTCHGTAFYYLLAPQATGLSAWIISTIGVIGYSSGILYWAWRTSSNLYEEIDLGSIINEKSSALFEDLASLRPVYMQDVELAIREELDANFPDLSKKEKKK